MAYGAIAENFMEQKNTCSMELPVSPVNLTHPILLWQFNIAVIFILIRIRMYQPYSSSSHLIIVQSILNKLLYSSKVDNFHKTFFQALSIFSVNRRLKWIRERWKQWLTVHSLRRYMNQSISWIFQFLCQFFLWF